MELPIKSKSICCYNTSKLTDASNNRSNKKTLESYLSTQFTSPLSTINNPEHLIYVAKITNFPSTTDSLCEKAYETVVLNTQSNQFPIQNLKKTNICKKRGEIQYYTNKMKMAEILNQTISVLDNSLEHESEVGNIKSLGKSKYLTDFKSLNLLEQIEYNKKWKLDVNKLSNNNLPYTSSEIKNSKIHNIKSELPAVKLSQSKLKSPQSKFCAYNNIKLTRIKPVKENYNNTKTKPNKIKTELTFEALDSIEKEIYQKFALNENQNKKFKIKINQTQLRNLSELQFVDFHKAHLPKPNKKYEISKFQIDQVKIEEDAKVENMFLKFQHGMKENINSYVEYSAKFGHESEEYDYITNVDKGLSMKNEIKNMFTGFIPPGNFVNFNTNSKKIESLHPRCVKTKFKKLIKFHDHISLSRLKNGKIYKGK